MELSDTVYKINMYEMLKEIKDGNTKRVVKKR